MSIVDMRGVGLRRGKDWLVRGIDWRIERGQHWAVVGANGSGKTTLMKIAGGTLFPTEGTVSVLGREFGKSDLMLLRRRIGWVGPALLAHMPDAEIARDIVASGLKATYGLVHRDADADAPRVDDALALAGLTGKAGIPFGVLSQGERQRALFARALVSDPDVFILDEACSSLDLPARETLLGMAGDVMAGGRATVVMVTHHIEEIPPAVTHAMVLKNGAVIAAGPAAETIRSGVLSEAFGMKVVVEERDGRFLARVGERRFPLHGK